MPLSVKHSGAWKPATPFVRHAGSWKPAVVWVRRDGSWKRASFAPVLFMSPNFQSKGQNASFHQFSPATLTVNGGNPASYQWGLQNTFGGTWSIVSGQGTASVIAQVTSVSRNNSASATLYCDAVIFGTTYRATSSLHYSYSGGGVLQPEIPGFDSAL